MRAVLKQRRARMPRSAVSGALLIRGLYGEQRICPAYARTADEHVALPPGTGRRYSIRLRRRGGGLGGGLRGAADDDGEQALAP